MTTEEVVMREMQGLPSDKKRAVLEFVRSLRHKQPQKKSYPTLRGICAHLGAHVSEEDLAQARREMWGNFPR